MIVISCKCGIEFEAKKCLVESGRKKYCSKVCFYKYRDLSQPRKKHDVSKGNSGWFKKGLTPWSALHPELCKPNKGSIKKGDTRGAGTQFKSLSIPKDYKPERNDYNSLHSWVRRKKGKPLKCCNCGSDKYVQWANKSHEYKRDINDFFELCRKCHVAYDKPTCGEISKIFGIGAYRKVLNAN